MIGIRRPAVLTRATGTGGALLAVFVLAGPLPAVAAGPVKVDAPNAPSFAPVIEAVSPAVVSVRARIDPARPSPAARNGFAGNPAESLFSSFASSPGGGARPVSQGSGFFVSADGYVVTNDDVVAGGGSFRIVLDGGKTFSAKLVGEDHRTDLAVLKVDSDRKDFTYLGFAREGEVKIGDWVVAVGNPYGLGATVTAGIVSSHGSNLGTEPYDDYIQFDARVRRGDAGGPAFDLTGKVVGVNASVFSPTGGGVGASFAVPASTARQVVHELIENGAVERGWLGVKLQPVTADIAASVGLRSAEGALVAALSDGAPAAKAGLRPGDVVRSIGGKQVDDPRALARSVGAAHPGDTVSLGVWRDGKAHAVEITLGKVPKTTMPVLKPAGRADGGGGSPLSGFGLTVVASDGDKGVVVTDVAAQSPADDRGLEAGDVIVSVGGESVHSAADVVSAIGDAAGRGRKAVLFHLQDKGRSRFIALPVEKG